MLQRKAAALLAFLIPCPVLAQIVLPPNAQTDCGGNGRTYAVRTDVTFSPGDVQAGRLRYGPCFGGSTAPGCTDLGGKCVTTEAERQSILAWAIWKKVGCNPPGRVRISFPSEQEIEDAGLVIGLAGRMQAEYSAACHAGPPAQTPTCPECPKCPTCPACPACPACPPCPPPVVCETFDPAILDLARALTALSEPERAAVETLVKALAAGN